jgi:uncharacterized membrane protein
MPFCPNCGSQTEGRFCAKCGASVEGAGAAAGGGPAQSTPVYTTPPGTSAVAAAGLEENVAGALCYVVGFITGILFLVLEPYNKRPFVRFHAFQSIIFSAAWIALSIAISIMFGIIGIAMGFMWPLLLLLRLVIGFGGFLLWLFLMFKAYNREKYMLPVIGPIAEKQANNS